MIYDHLIIGAGISGLFLGLELKKAGNNFVILEKSKGVGGRIATRRINNLGVDHGAPYLKTNPLLSGLIKEFEIHDSHSSHDGLYIDGGMTSLPKKMAEHLPVLKDEKIVHVEQSKDIWICRSERGSIYQTKKLIITSPLPQTLELLSSSGIETSQNPDLQGCRYTKGVLGIFLVDEEVLMSDSLPENVHSVLRMRDRKLNPYAWVLRTDEKFSAKYFEHSDEENLTRIESLFINCFDNAPKISHRELKKWRYVVPETALPYPFLELQKNLFLIGDSFLYPDIHGALLSAKTLAENLI